MQSEGVDFICNVEVGKDVTADQVRRHGCFDPLMTGIGQLKSKFDAVLLTVGATKPRDLPIPGRNLKNIYFAMEFLGKQQQALFRQNPELMTNAISFRAPYKVSRPLHPVSCADVAARATRTGSSSMTAASSMSVESEWWSSEAATQAQTVPPHPHGCKSLVNLELLDKPPPTRDEIANAWPAYPRIFRTDYGQEEVKKRDGADPRKYAVMTKEFIGDEQGNVKAIKIVSLKVTLRCLCSLPDAAAAACMS
eukprot:766718-Hanusia_phi.AAC.4